MDRLFLLILLALPLAAQAIVIDNGIPIGTIGHWSVDVLTGGATQSAVFTTQRLNSTDLITENVVSSYRVFVDPGIDGQGFELQGSEPEITIFNQVASFGTFIGANGNAIRWSVASEIFPGERHLRTRYRFDGDNQEPIGPLRVLQYLDGDIQGSDDDVFHPAGSSIEILDNIELFGVRQTGTFGGATFAGQAVDRFDQIQGRIAGSGQPVSTTVATINLPSFEHPRLGFVYGPANVVSVLAWDVIPGVSNAQIDTSLGIAPPPPVLCMGLTPTIVGTDGNDLLLGTPGNDVIHGLAGNDRIAGLGGPDVICGGTGRDLIEGGAGEDRLSGQADRDRLDGGTGRDRCEGGAGEDTFTACERIITECGEDDPECDEPRPVEPAKKQFSCRTSGCAIPTTCNLATACDTKVDLFVNVKSIRLSDDTASRAPGRTRFAAAVANIPPFTTLTVRPTLTKRGRRILRANRNKTIKGVITIRNAPTGDLFSSTRVRIRLK